MTRFAHLRPHNPRAAQEVAGGASLRRESLLSHEEARALGIRGQFALDTESARVYLCHDTPSGVLVEELRPVRRVPWLLFDCDVPVNRVPGCSGFVKDRSKLLNGLAYFCPIGKLFVFERAAPDTLTLYEVLL
jgi:hypothetical protein